MKDTAFTKFHIELGARMVPFAGYNMPLEYTGLKEEHLNVRTGVGVFDVSHMGEFLVSGTKAFNLVQRLTTNDISTLTPGKVQYTCFPNGKGGIVDDLLVYQLEEKKYLLVVNAANIEKDWEWCTKYAIEMGLTPGQDIQNLSDYYCQLAVQGPFALKAMQKICSEQVENMEYYTFKKLKIGNIHNAIFSTTGYTGSGGCEIYVPQTDGEELWKAVFEAGKEFGIKPAGLACRDTLRLEMGFCLYGNDIDENHSPIEAGLGWITKFTENNNFIDRQFLEDQKNNGVSRRLKGFEMIDRGIPRQGYEIVDQNGTKIGDVTSGTHSPSLDKAIGMGYFNKGFWNENCEIFIRIRNKDLKAKIVKTPFYKG